MKLFRSRVGTGNPMPDSQYGDAAWTSENTAHVSHCYSLSYQAAEEAAATIRHLDRLHPTRQADTIIHHHRSTEVCGNHQHRVIKAGEGRETAEGVSV